MKTDEKVRLTIEFANEVEKEKFKQKIIDAGIKINWNTKNDKKEDKKVVRKITKEERDFNLYVIKLKSKIPKYD